MQISRIIKVSAPIEKVWSIVAEHYHHVGRWASAVNVSKENTSANKVNGSAVGGRICETSLGPFRETIEIYNPANKTLQYSATGDKMPFFVKSLGGHWQLKRLSDNQTEVSMTFNADLMFPFSMLMGWMMRMQFAKAINETLEELACYAETDDVHQRKKAMLVAAA